MTEKNHAETIRDLTIEGLMQPVAIDLAQPENGERQLIVLPNGDGGYEINDVTPPHTLPPPRPTYVSQVVQVQDAASLIAYVNRFKSDATMLFANLNTSSIEAALDYHQRGGLDGALPAQADLVAHRADMTLPFSEEWRTWTEIDGKMMSQLAFVRFLEENAVDIVAPATADLIEVCRDIQGLRNVEFTSVVRAESNTAERFMYADTSGVRGKGEVDIPREFTLSIPVYFNDRAYDIRALLRNEIEDGKLKLGIKLWRREYVRQTAFRNVMGEIETATNITPLFGCRR